MHALVREIWEGQDSQGQRSILSPSISLCFLQPSFVVCHGKNSNESFHIAEEIPARHKSVFLSALHFQGMNFLSLTVPSHEEGTVRLPKISLKVDCNGTDILINYIVLILWFFTPQTSV